MSFIRSVLYQRFHCIHNDCVREVDLYKKNSACYFYYTIEQELFYIFFASSAIIL